LEEVYIYIVHIFSKNENIANPHKTIPRKITNLGEWRVGVGVRGENT
jgi:hypothetical protein